MRKFSILIIVFAIMWVFSACGENGTDILGDFKDLMEQPVSSDNAVEASLFLDEKIDSVDKEVAMQMVAMYRDYLYDYILAQKDKTRLQEVSVYFDKETGLFDEEKIKNSSHGEYYEKLQVAGLMFCPCEESLTLKIDYGNLLERFDKYLSESMKNFYELEQLVAEKPATENAKLVISWKELIGRAYMAEEIITSFPEDEIIKKDVLWVYKRYMGIILMGTTNTPIFDYETKEFSENALKAYRDFMKEEPEAVLTWVLGNHIEYLNSINLKVDFNDQESGKAFLDNCDLLISEGEKRLGKK